MGQRTSVYLDDSLQAAAKASGIPLAELVRRGLAVGAEPATQATEQAAAPLTTLPDGEPSPGVACAGPGCWQRNTARFGLHRLPLCPACKAALEGRTHQREMPASAVRLARCGAA
jgi:hypothetical protein